MSDLIDREKLYDDMLYGMCGTGYQTRALSVIKSQPTVDVAPVVHGHWITRNEGNPMFLYGECSICKFEQSISHFLNYCPNCAAKMDEVIE